MLRRIKNYIMRYIFLHIDSMWEEKEYESLLQLKKNFSKVGGNFVLGKNYRIPDARNIEIGENFRASERFRAEVFYELDGFLTNSKLIIGDNVTFHTDVHLACANRIEIGDECLFASRIFITDHSHGNSEEDEIQKPPRLRKIISKGPVIIGKNVWIGEGVSILANVKIGDNAIIGTNSVVTKDVPKNAVVGGVPARELK